MKLSDIFSDHMIFQRNKEICIYGSGSGEGSVEFCGTTTVFVSEGDIFRAYLPAQPAGGPYDMTVTLNGETAVFRDILVGDVYLAGGQSNMEMKLNETSDIDRNDCPDIRYFEEPHAAYFHFFEGGEKYNNLGWQVCRGDAPENWSAVSYAFAQNLYKKTGVPVGIISCNMGASRVDSWTAPEIVNTAEYQALMPEKHNDYNVFGFNQNSWLYCNKLSTVVPYTLNGVLWYQGESNRHPAEAPYYGDLLRIMMQNWRDVWSDNLTFYCVQLMPYEESVETADWAALRSCIEKVSKSDGNAYMVTLMPTGEEKLIHPTCKKSVGIALSNAVLTTKFNIPTEYCGPVLDGIKGEGNSIFLTFSHADGLGIDGDELKDTYVIDAAGNKYPVYGKAEGNTLVCSWDSSVIPAQLSMGYGNVPRHNLYNSAGYLASPFKIEL